VPLRATEAEQALVGTSVDEKAAVMAAGAAISDVSPTGDIHGSAEYRRDLCEVMVRRAITLAAHRARGEVEPDGSANGVAA
jgi:aerobic carbon-monoxide dehydrogenase medium subunit